MRKLVFGHVTHSAEEGIRIQSLHFRCSDHHGTQRNLLKNIF